MSSLFTPSVVGLGIGLIFGLVITFPRFWPLLFFPIVGFIIGKIMESEQLRAKIRELIGQFFQ